MNRRDFLKAALLALGYSAAPALCAPAAGPKAMFLTFWARGEFNGNKWTRYTRELNPEQVQLWCRNELYINGRDMAKTLSMLSERLPEGQYTIPQLEFH